MLTAQVANYSTRNQDERTYGEICASSSFDLTEQDKSDLAKFELWLQRKAGKTKARWLFRDQRRRMAEVKDDDPISTFSNPELERYMLWFYHEIGFHENPQIKSPVQRKSGETSVEFMARTAALLRIGEAARPELDVLEALRTASSQLDAVSDELDAFRNDPDYFISVIQSRIAFSAQQVPDLKGQSRSEFTPKLLVHEVLQTVFELHASHMTWAMMTAGLSHLIILGIVTDGEGITTVEGLIHLLEEFKDAHVLNLFLSLQAAVSFWGTVLHKKLQTQMAASPLFRDRVIRLEDREIPELSWGYPIFMPKHSLPPRPTADSGNLEHYMLRFLAGGGLPSVIPMYCALASASPAEKNQLDQTVFDTLGEHSMAQDLRAVLIESRLGQEISRRSLATNSDREHDIYNWNVTMMSWFSETAKVSRATRSTKFLPSLEYVRDPANFKALWDYLDTSLADFARRSTDPNLRTKFGLPIIDEPTPPPSPTRSLPDPPQQQSRQHRPSESSDSLAPSWLETNHAQERAISGHVYATRIEEELRIKEKSRPATISFAADEPPENVDEAQADTQDRTAFRLSRKVVKVFRRFLDDDKDEDPNLKKGQLKWNDFEKAMTKVGFRIKQSCGSSVRFDPPPEMHDSPSITFHRPHPDPVLTPGLIRRIGYRLHRRLGWKASDFVVIDKTQDAAGEAL
ncbi:hypothetical protein JAAARDRAFT_72366 [Jaapia argillacea MUCL 33604]|uniref:Uncharacterized protein n=1 Tax=Jaapia argillacea MUCL 33604 TaxID=933084 RepID=A0A067PIQ6_9AGAM|nr:hypothetical protein JAAARDRAFT_72366 [Jaapia argillacea MUCL 33604]